MTARSWLPRATLVVALAVSSLGVGLAQAGPAAAVAVTPTDKSFSTARSGDERRNTPPDA